MLNLLVDIISLSRNNTKHLYFVSQIDLANLKWYIDDTNTVRKAVILDEDYWSKRQNYKQILATTNITLGLPLIPDSYLQDYLLAKIPPTQVTIEMEQYMTNGWVPSYNNPDNANLDPSAELAFRPKTKDNYIIIYEFPDDHELGWLANPNEYPAD